MDFILLQASGGGTNMGFLYTMGAVFLVMYIFMIRPQQKKQKELKKFREELKKGEEVVTTGGIYGKIVSVSDQKVTLQIDTTTKIVVSKESISHQVKEKAE